MNTGSKEIKKFLKLKTKAEEKGNLQEESECCNVLGNEYLKLCDHDNALLMHKSELHICQSLHDATGEGIACRNIGDVYVAMGEFRKAIEYHTKHFKLSAGNNVELQRANTSLGRTYLEMGKTLEKRAEAQSAFVRSIKFLKESLQMVAILKDTGKSPQSEINAMKIRSLINLGLCHHHLSGISRSNEKTNAIVKSKEFFQKALYLAKKFNFKEDLYLANYILSTVHLDQKRYSNALRNVEEAISLAKVIAKSDLSHQALDLCSQVHLHMENIEASKLCLKKIYKRDEQNRMEIETRLKTVIRMCRINDEINSSNQSNSDLFRLHEILADMYCQLSCFSSAVKHYKFQESLLPLIPNSTSQQKRSVYFSIASTLADADEYEEAMKYYYKEIECTVNKAEHTKTFTYIANCLEKLNCSYDDIAKIYDKALESAAEANDDLLTLRTLLNLEETQKLFNDQTNLDKTRSKIGELELKLQVCADELNCDENDESFRHDCFEDDETLESELVLSDQDDDSDRDELLPRRRRTNFSKTNEKGESQLHRACIDGQLKTVEVLVKQGHPVNPRDFCGWIPLHEACNHGHLDIVKFLIKNGANVNDTGGKHCDNITPINDAAINGHFEVVQLLLDTGANPNIASIRKKTTLDSLMYYYHQHKEDLDVDSKKLYKVLLKRLKEAADSPPEYFTQVQNSNLLSSAMLIESNSIDDDESYGSVSPPPLSALVDDHLPSLYRDEKPRNFVPSRKRILIPDNSDDEKSDSEFTFSRDRLRNFEKTKKSEATLSKTRLTSSFGNYKTERQNFSRGFTTVPRLFEKPSKISQCVTALTNEEEHVDDDDWLVNDISEYSQPIKKPKRNSSELKRAEPMQSDWSNHHFSDQLTPSFNSPQPITADQESKQKQQPITTLRLRLKINDRSFIFAVPGRDKTIAWLINRASARYEEVANMKPNLSLSTSDGCLLSPDDAVVDVLNSNDTVIGVADSWRTVPLSEQYTEACAKERLHVLPYIRQACVTCQTSKTFQLSNCGYSFRKQLKPVLACLGQHKIQRILLPGNRLFDEGVASLCSSFNAPSPNPRLQLTELDLKCCGLGDESLLVLNLCSSLHEIRRLNLSYNQFSDGQTLFQFLNKLKKLQDLLLESCSLSDTMLESETFQNTSFEGLRLLNISQNSLSSRGVFKWLNLLDRSRLKAVHISNMFNSSNNNSLISVFADFVGQSREVIELLDFSHNQLTENQLLNTLKTVQHLINEIAI